VAAADAPAAARAKLMTPAEMVERLDRRLDLLATASTSTDAKHRTLRDTLDWSFELLSEEERGAFRRLSLFTGPFSLEAAERLLTTDPVASLRLLEALVDHSLVRVLPGAPRRFTLLATVRTYGRERLDEAGEREAAERARAEYLLSVAEAAAKELTGSEQRAWFARLGELHADLDASLSYLAEAGDVDRGLRLASALWRYWVAQGHMVEARGHFERLLALPHEEDGGPVERAVVRAESLEGYGALLQELGDRAALGAGCSRVWGCGNAWNDRNASRRRSTTYRGSRSTSVAYARPRRTRGVRSRCTRPSVTHVGAPCRSTTSVGSRSCAATSRKPPYCSTSASRRVSKPATSVVSPTRGRTWLGR